MKKSERGGAITAAAYSVSLRMQTVNRYSWVFITDFTGEEKEQENINKALELNRKLIDVFNRYGDETVVVTDKNGYIEFAGEEISRTCGVAPEYFLGKSVYDIERAGIFRPSISVKVLGTKKPQVTIQRTQTGAELVSVGAPVLNEMGEIEKIVSVTRDYSNELKISEMIAGIMETKELQREGQDDKFDEIITCNDAMFEIKTMVKMIAATKATVLISGETGTGKEMIAKYIYRLSDRKDKPFIKVNCGTISPSLVESELFGYEEGSFTGAVKGGRIGLVEAANSGTLFLDEVGELPLEQQVKILHVLQDKVFTRVGGTREINVDVRIIVATNKDLEEEVKRGNFREDLYYRLNVIPIKLPPLRKRREDVPLLSKHFLNETCAKYNKEVSLSSNVMARLKKYDWPGNIRQLENVIERIVLTAKEPMITVKNLPEMFRDVEMNRAVQVNKVIRLSDAYEELEKEMIKMAIEESGTTVKAAEVLGVNQSTVSRKMAQYGIGRKTGR